MTIPRIYVNTSELKILVLSSLKATQQIRTVQNCYYNNKVTKIPLKKVRRKLMKLVNN